MKDGAGNNSPGATAASDRHVSWHEDILVGGVSESEILTFKGCFGNEASLDVGESREYSREDSCCKEQSEQTGPSDKQDVLIFSDEISTGATQILDEIDLQNKISCEDEAPIKEGAQIAQQIGLQLKTSSEDEGGLSKDPLDSTRINVFQKPGSCIISVNAGGPNVKALEESIVFQEDKFFSGGHIVATNARIGDAHETELYQTARCGNCSYYFPDISSGEYLIDLHLAEIVFIDGPPGKRVFDVSVQGKMILSGIDIFSRVGSNTPLVIPNLQIFVNDEAGLAISFSGVNGLPIISGISIRKGISSAGTSQAHEMRSMPSIHGAQRYKTERHGTTQENSDGNGCSSGGDACHFQGDSSFLQKELAEMKRVMEQLKRENEFKNKECIEAWTSLHEIQNELVRKSMHVGSLACAVEDQVKERSRCFFSLQDLCFKIKNLKAGQVKLSEEFANEAKDLTNQIQSAVSKYVDSIKQNEDFKAQLIEETKERKKLYNKVLELKGNIRVFCRCRPLNSNELADGVSMAVDFESAKEGELLIKSNSGSRKSFRFDAVFIPQADQATVFEGTAPFAASVLDGYNVCIFAYGQTGAGKTFTMEGTEEARGVNYRTLEELFRIIEKRKKTFKYEMSVSVLEVYNEQIRDLLVSETHPTAPTKRLEIRQGELGMHHVPGLVETNVHSINEVWEVLRTGTNARAVGSTNANEHSSRSHCIHCVMVKAENLVNGEKTQSKLWLVDLAGSERIAKTEVQGDRLKEAQNINKSLSALGDVISALSNKSAHIPFRNSKLTHLLQDSLGGDAKTLMFVQISPNENDLSETICSLNFASRVRGIELGPAKKQVDASELTRYKQLVEKCKLENKSKDELIKNLEVKLKLKESSYRVNVIRPLMEYNRSASSAVPGSMLKYSSLQKENKPETITNDEESVYTKKAGRSSICTTGRHVPTTPMGPRRNSIATLPSTKAVTSLPPPLRPTGMTLPPPLPRLMQTTNLARRYTRVWENGAGECTSEALMSARVASILRRSIHKKVYIKSPLPPPQQSRRINTFPGIERMRVSFGSQGRQTQRVLANNFNKDRFQQQRDKERGWNHGSMKRL